MCISSHISRVLARLNISQCFRFINEYISEKSKSQTENQHADILGVIRAILDVIIKYFIKGICLEVASSIRLNTYQNSDSTEDYIIHVQHSSSANRTQSFQFSIDAFFYDLIDDINQIFTSAIELSQQIKK